MGAFVETIKPGAFTKTIARDDVRALVNHDASKILGRTKSGTLTLREDTRGLYCEISPPDTTVGRDVVESVKRGDLDGMSFGFSAVDVNWDGRTEVGQQLRELHEVRLYDVSVVTYPAYPSTSVAMRSLLFPDGGLRGDDTTQRPSRSDPYSWMSPEMQKFYRRQDRLHKLDKELASVDSDSVFGRKLKVERELVEIKQDRDLEENRAMRARHHERWARKDSYALWPVHGDPEVYAKKPTEKKHTKDPWAAYRLV
jgi:HK97 family phage prohead protease